MYIRKRVGSGKSKLMNIQEDLRVAARDHVNRTVTLSFTLDSYSTEFSITLMPSEVDELVSNLFVDKIRSEK